jgi:hypothetical protein
MMTGVDLSSGFCLISAHHDVDEYHLRLVVADLGKGIESVFRENDFVSSLAQKHFRAAPDGVAVIYDENLRGVRRAHGDRSPSLTAICTDLGPGRPGNYY